jgi:hypothetical protein
MSAPAPLLTFYPPIDARAHGKLPTKTGDHQVNGYFLPCVSSGLGQQGSPLPVVGLEGRWGKWGDFLLASWRPPGTQGREWPQPGNALVGAYCILCLLMTRRGQMDCGEAGVRCRAQGCQ